MTYQKEIVIRINPDYTPEEGTPFDAVVAALEHFEIPASLVERDMPPEEGVPGEAAFLPVGTKIHSYNGEMSDTAVGQDVYTGHSVIGTIVGVFPDQEACYSVAFPKGVSVFLSRQEIEGPNYDVVEGDLSDEPVAWDVEMGRTAYQSASFRVEARHRKEAERLAYEEAGDHVYGEKASDYEIQYVGHHLDS